MTDEPPDVGAGSHAAATMDTMAARMIDTWFPCREVDRAVKTPAGSGLSEKGLFTWFASRPIAQARAAVLCALLPDDVENRTDIRAAVEFGDPKALERLRGRIVDHYGSKPPVVLDVFSGRGIIPLEAARLGVTSIGTDLSPVATLAGRLLADFPLRDWSTEAPLPRQWSNGPPSDADSSEDHTLFASGTGEPRLVHDVRVVLAEVGRRVAYEVAPMYPGNEARNGELPWSYLWAVTIPCDRCKRRFPLIGSMVLRYPYAKSHDLGQALRLITDADSWRTEVITGEPQQEPTFASADGKRGKSARCPFPSCGAVHSLDSVKAKGFAQQYEDAMLAVAESEDDTTRKVFRVPTAAEVDAARSVDLTALPRIGRHSAVPDEMIPEGNVGVVYGRGYGYMTYGDLMNKRQAFLFATTARVIGELYTELKTIVSASYAEALAAYAAANLPRQLRRATRGVHLNQHGKPDGSQQNRLDAGDVFSSQSVLKHQFDYVEVGPGTGPGTWGSVSTGMVNALKVIVSGSTSFAKPGRFQRASATALPYRDASVDALVCDPPYYDMITYADASDLAHVWLKRALTGAIPDLFDGRLDGADGLQDKAFEIIVKSKGINAPGEHRTTDFYESMLAKSFAEARRVLKSGGHLTAMPFS